ncbi:MAG: RNA 2',3'-cyclic phosphodiesterase, partial [Methanopyri archaeon]|nr:RNA 2',3'-cyclic phosphodiesterase [Methanopyri archaeon]
MVRAFIGIGLEAITSSIEDVIKPLLATGADTKFVEPRNLHVNLKFLGDIPDERTGPLTDVLSEVAGRNTPFTLHVRSSGVFPNPRRVRVVWLGLEPSSALSDLHEDVEQAAEGLGFRRDTRSYRPHIT